MTDWWSVPSPVWGLTSFIFGLLIGSFLNVCIVRLPKEETVVGGRSHCPQCGHDIAWYDNIPLLSILILGGKCRHCGGTISLRYPLVEFLTGVLFWALHASFGLTMQFFFYAYLAGSLVVATFVDWEHQIIPDEVTLAGSLVGLTATYAFPGLQGEMDRRLALGDSALGMLVGIGLIYAMALFGRFIFKKESMGGGDLKLLAMIGTFIGWEKTVLAFFIAPLIGAPVGLMILWKHKGRLGSPATEDSAGPEDKKDKEDTKEKKVGEQEEAKSREGLGYIAFGPYLSLGALAALFWGERILVYFFPYPF